MTAPGKNILDRLAADPKADGTWDVLVLAALEGAEALRAFLDAPDSSRAPGSTRAQNDGTSHPEGGGPGLARHPEGRQPGHRPEGSGTPEPKGAYLKSITVEGFRGIGHSTTARPPPRPRPHPRRRPQRLRQEQLRRSPGAARHRRHVPLGQPHQGLARGLAQPPPQARQHRGRVPHRGREGADVHRREVGGRRRPRRRQDPRPDPGQEADGRGRPRLERGPPDLSPVPVLQRARLDAGRGPVQALRRARGHPRAGEGGGSARDAGRGPPAPRESPQGSGAEEGRARRQAQDDRGRPLPQLSSKRWRRRTGGWTRSRRRSFEPPPAARPTATSRSSASSPTSRHRKRRPSSPSSKDLREAHKQVTDAAGTLAAHSQDLANILDQALLFHKKHGDANCPICGKKDALDAQWRDDQKPSTS